MVLLEIFGEALAKHTSIYAEGGRGRKYFQAAGIHLTTQIVF